MDIEGESVEMTTTMRGPSSCLRADVPHTSGSGSHVALVGARAGHRRAEATARTSQLAFIGPLIVDIHRTSIVPTRTVCVWQSAVSDLNPTKGTVAAESPLPPCHSTPNDYLSVSSIFLI